MNITIVYKRKGVPTYIIETARVKHYTGKETYTLRRMHTASRTDTAIEGGVNSEWEREQHHIIICYIILRDIMSCRSML